MAKNVDSVNRSQKVQLYEGNALALDAQGYAEEHGLDLEEAIARLRLQAPAGELGAELAANEADTFAGAWIQHTPEFRIIVQFTESGEDTIRPYIESGPLSDLVEVRAASVTLAELEVTQETAWLMVRDLGVPVESGINVFKNYVELYVVEREQNEYVCKRGKQTGFGCGYIINKNHKPSCDADGYCYTSTFIRVHRDGVNLSSGGDSGGPWFSGNTAYGVMRGSLGDDATYMAVNYVSFLGLTVLTN